MMKLDKLDKKILVALDNNSRIPTTVLGKQLRVSREVVGYRIQRLIDKKIIRSFFTHIHPEKFGFTNYEVYFKIKGMNESQRKNLIHYFCSRGQVLRVATCNGMYDLIVQVTEKDIYKLNTLLQDCLQKYDSFFMSKDITLTTKLHYGKKKFLGETVNDSVLYGVKKGHLTVDDLDKELLRWLSNNSRMPIIELAKKIKLTSSAVLYRIKELEKKGIIEGYSCTIHAPRLGLVYCKIMLTLAFGHKIKEKELHQYCLQNKNVIRFLYCIGHWDFEIDVMTGSLPEFHDFLKEIKNRFSVIIRDCVHVTIAQSYKYIHFPHAYDSEIEY